MTGTSDAWILTWYVARSAGIVAWALLALSVLVGLVQSTRVTSGRPGPVWLRSFHANAGGLAIVFTLVHMVALLLDRTVQFSVVDLLVPFAADWRPLPVAMGIVAFDVLLAVGMTAWLRQRLPRGLWLKVHRIAVLAYGLATAHLLTAGTDVTSRPLMTAVLASLLASGALLMTRIVLARGRTRATEQAVRA